MMAIAMVTANSRNTRPTMPPIRRTGMKTAISETVIEHRHVDRRGDLRAIRRQPGAHRIHDRDRVGVRLALDRQHDRAFVVEQACDLVVLDTVDDARDLVELHWRAIAIRDHDLAV